MNKFRFFILFFILFFNACSKDEKEISLIKENRQDLEMISAYQEAYKALEDAGLDVVSLFLLEELL